MRDNYHQRVFLKIAVIRRLGSALVVLNSSFSLFILKVIFYIYSVFEVVVYQSMLLYCVVCIFVNYHKC